MKAEQTESVGFNAGFNEILILNFFKVASFFWKFCFLF